MTILSRIMRSKRPDPKPPEFEVGQKIPAREIRHWNRVVKVPHAQFENPCVVIEVQNPAGGWWKAHFRDVDGKIGAINQRNIFTRQMILRRKQ